MQLHYTHSGCKIIHLHENTFHPHSFYSLTSISYNLSADRLEYQHELKTSYYGNIVLLKSNIFNLFWYLVILLVLFPIFLDIWLWTSASIEIQWTWIGIWFHRHDQMKTFLQPKGLLNTHFCWINFKQYLKWWKRSIGVDVETDTSTN